MSTVNPPLQVVYEDNHLIIVNKRPGELVQGDRTGDLSLDKKIKAYLAEKYRKQGNVFLGVVHRLDRPTSGLVLYARTSKALERMNKLFRDRNIDKTYWALVQGHMKDDSAALTHYLKKNPKNNKSTVFQRESPEAKKAVLHFKRIKALERYDCLEIQLETGRHHQIRAQLAYIGHPIKGDLKYGASRSNPNGGIHLHARRLAFVHPVKKEAMEFTAAPPSDPLWAACLKD